MLMRREQVQVQEKQETEAQDPMTDTERLRVLAPLYPLQVAANPNSDPQTLDSLTSWNDAEPKTVFALCWTVQENPAIDMLLLENPAHPLLSNVHYMMASARLALALLPLAQHERIAVFVEAFRQQLPWMRKIHGVATRKFKSGLRALLQHAKDVSSSNFAKWRGINIGDLPHGKHRDKSLFDSLGAAYQRASHEKIAGLRVGFEQLQRAIVQQRLGRESSISESQSLEWRVCAAEVNDFLSDLLERYAVGERFPAL